MYFSEGDYDYYIEKRKTRVKNILTSEAKEKKEDSRVKPKTKKLTWKESKELETIEEEIIKTENEIERIEGIFSSPDYYDKFAAQTKELNTQLEQAKMKIKNLFDRWEELEKINNSNI